MPYNRQSNIGGQSKINNGNYVLEKDSKGNQLWILRDKDNNIIDYKRG